MMTRKPGHRRRPEARPDEILDAALFVFVEAGFSAAKMDIIARQAGVSKGALYLYFDSKEAMLRALIERSVGKVAKSLSQKVNASLNDDPVQTCRTLFRALFVALSDPAINAAPRLVFSEAGRFPEMAKFYRENVIDIARQALTRLIDMGGRQGVFRAMDVDAVMRCVMGPALANMMLTTVFVQPGDTVVDPLKMADEISDIMLNGLRPRAGDSL